MAEKNLIWLVFDSIRGDRTTIGGHSRNTTPELAEIGSQSDGVAGTCFAHGIWSQPSVASMMTGTYPSTHGSGSYNEVLPSQIPTVAERFSEEGYRTIGVSSNPYFSPTTGTERGFDRFDFVSGTELVREAGVSSVLSFLKNIRTFSGGFKPDKQKHTPDFLLNEIVKNRLDTVANDESPFFLAAHYYGAHHPYYPSPAFRGRFAGDLPIPADKAADIGFDESNNVYEKIAQRGFGSEADKEVVTAMYDAQIAQVDALVSRLRQYIQELGIDDETIVVITSDHGDLLGELGLVSHKLLLHDALIEVPIAVQGSEYLSQADLGLSQHADIMQTVLAELGIDTDGMQGIQLENSSRDMAVAQRGAETYQKTLDKVRTHTSGFDHDHIFGGFVTALRTEEWKYVSAEEETALYRLPTEDEDVKSNHPEVVDEFEGRLTEWRAQHGSMIGSEETAEFDETVEDLLTDLGYVVK